VRWGGIYTPPPNGQGQKQKKQTHTKNKYFAGIIKILIISLRKLMTIFKIEGKRAGRNGTGWSEVLSNQDEVMKPRKNGFLGRISEAVDVVVATERVKQAVIDKEVRRRSR